MGEGRGIYSVAMFQHDLELFVLQVFFIYDRVYIDIFYYTFKLLYIFV